jgi:NAD(P)-dependent dehydrogenase (short-subunit alcohol dehydrogenase family)
MPMLASAARPEGLAPRTPGPPVVRARPIVRIKTQAARDTLMAMSQRTASRRALITGGKRGLGLEFARQWLARGDEVVVLARRPESSRDLADLARLHPGALTTVDCDVASDASVEAARRRVERTWDRLDLLVNNAGIIGKDGGSIDGIDLEEVRDLIEVNTLGPLRVCRAFVPLLRNGTIPKIVHITSLRGSIDDNRSGGYWGYRLSKAALNMASRNLAVSLNQDGIVSVVLHPGWVRTGMGGQDAPLSPEEAVAAMVRTIDDLTLQKSGGFFDRTGKPCPW